MISKSFSEEHHYGHVKIAKCLYLISAIPHSYTGCFALYQTPWILGKLRDVARLWILERLRYVIYYASGRSIRFYKTMRTLEII
jgi:hypothetical protein